MSLSVQPLSETRVSSAISIGSSLYVNVWTSAPSVEELRVVIEAERRMPMGYLSLNVIERADRLTFETGVRELYRGYVTEVAQRLRTSVAVMRAGGFAGAVVHGLVGTANAFGIQTPLANTLEDGLELLHKDSDINAAAVHRAVLEHIAVHVTRVPPPGRS